MAIKIGKKAPLFSLRDKDGREISLKESADNFTVVYFYPKDNTPGCTIEAQEFTKAIAKFKSLKTTILGISGGDEKSKTKFCAANKLKVTLLSDPDFAVAKSYDSFGEKTFMGRKFMGIFRKTVLLDKELKVVKIYDAVSPQTHAAEILQDIKALKTDKVKKKK